MHDFTDVELNQIESLIGREPAWLLKSGTTLLFCILVLGLVLSFFVRFPDSINAEILFTSNAPPVNVTARIDGKIEKLFVTDGQLVERGQRLALLQNDANFEQITLLSQSLIDFNIQHHISAPRLNKIINLDELGEVQSTYNAWLNAIKQLQHLSEYRTDLSNIESLLQLKEIYVELDKDLQKQLTTSEQRMRLQSTRLESHSQLVKGGVLGSLDLIDEQQERLSLSQSYDDLQIQLKRNQLSLIEAEKQIKELKFQRKANLAALENNVTQNTLRLKASIHDWEKKHLLTSPVSGMVSASLLWSEYQDVESGSTLMLIMQHHEATSARLYLPERGAATVRVGQRVKIEIDSYPKNQYGILTGKVDKVSKLISPKGYPVNITIPQEKKTNHGRTLLLTPGMTGKATIITEDYSLLERLFDVFISAYHNTLEK